MTKAQLVLALLVSVSFGAAAARGDDRRPPPPRPRPPKEAVAACASKRAGDACTFKGREGEVSGTCFKPDDAPSDAPLACKPAGDHSR